MPITAHQVAAAQAIQHAAAHDPSTQVRVIAGPGTGKSFAIQERVAWLLASGVSPTEIYVVSFTRASARDLRVRVIEYCRSQNISGADLVSITTLHSLALRALRRAGLLVYPSDPLVLDNWELDFFHDPEFSSSTGYRPGRVGGSPPARSREIRMDYEAFCGTGQWNPPGYILPRPPITLRERQSYGQYHQISTQLYACVLPGEIVRQCADNMVAGVFDPTQELAICHLIVDEYQDLNPSDLEFVDRIIAAGAIVFVAGDDDQSLYSFRYASPSGIQSFRQRHPTSAHHVLSDCFRSTPNVLAPALSLIQAFSDPSRIPKQLSSLFINSSPPESGIVHRWRFSSGTLEARAIARSCRELVSAGIPPREIMILLSNTRATLPPFRTALAAEGVPFESPRSDSVFDSPATRFALAMLRIACQPGDYVALRPILGLYPGVGPTICDGIAQAAIANNINYRDLFYLAIPSGVLAGRQMTALRHARSTCNELGAWQPTDTLSQWGPRIDQMIRPMFGDQPADALITVLLQLPPDATLQEMRDFIWADTDEQRARILTSVYQRLGIEEPAAGFLPPQVRVMTMHGSKGLGANIVFIPALEEQILPGPRRQPIPGLVLEAARMLYVSITRARAACILSYAVSRYLYGNVSSQVRSRFVPSLAGPFTPRTSPLEPREVADIVASVSNL